MAKRNVDAGKMWPVVQLQAEWYLTGLGARSVCIFVVKYIYRTCQLAA